MKSEYQRLECDIREILSAMEFFTPSEIGEVEEFLFAGEYGLALETLCGIAYEEKKAIPREIYPKLCKIAEAMEIETSWWNELTVYGGGHTK